ncbi:hypothetical protein BJX61DRAFT_483928 [Aspergillus egyptiacus]|nr:hypothetical protein BJX61DRAFT_483928 [Aspergillus egyptiacus]
MAQTLTMSTPERKSGQTSWARRQQQQQQQQQQQHNSPFRRARRDSLHLDVFDGFSPPRESSATHLPNFSKTGSLRGAFEFASRLPEEEEEDIFLSEFTRRNSPRKRRQGSGTMSSHSNPPDELAEAYRRIEDENSLTDLDVSDGENVYTSSANKVRRIPSSSRREHRMSVTSDTSLTSDSPRRRTSNYARDEERLRRATSSRSPVLNKAVLGNGPSSEHLQRRDSHTASVTSEEGDDGVEPSVNIPSTWGSRARHNQGWLKSLTRNHERTPTAEESEETSSRLRNGSARRAAESAETVGRPPSRLGFSPPRIHTSPKRDESSSEGQAIPNTPVVVFPSSTFTKRSPSKRDSHDLLRKLARTGSPAQNQTADATQTPEQPTGRRVYDKTPRVTGAWIDTPMTERMRPIPPLRPTNVSEPKETWSFGKLSEKASRDDEEPDAQKPIFNFEPIKEEVEEKPAELGKPLIEEIPETRPPKKEEEPAQRYERPRESGKPSEKDSKPELPLPDHPKSALETVLQDHKSNKESLDVGDDTLESLQALVDQPPPDSQAQEDDGAYEQQVLEQLESATAQTSDMKDFDRIEGKLQSLSDTMAHVKTGLDHLGDQVSRDTEAIRSTLRKKASEPTHTQPRGCDCKHGEKGLQNTIPIPRLWYQGDAWWKIRPTRLGWFVLTALTWYLSESTMCDHYCHPFVSSSCEGNCLDPNAPRFPFVIPTMVWRWLHLRAILLPLWTILVAFGRFFSQLLGLSDGYVDDISPALNLTGKVRVGGTPVGSFPPAASATAASIKGFIPIPQWTWSQETQADPGPVDSRETIVRWDDLSMEDDELL